MCMDSLAPVHRALGDPASPEPRRVPAPLPGRLPGSCRSSHRAEPFDSSLSFWIPATANTRSNSTGASDQRFLTATLSGKVSVNPCRVYQKLLYLYFPGRSPSFWSKPSSFHPHPPYPRFTSLSPPSPLLLTSPVITILFFSLPHSGTECGRGAGRPWPLLPTRRPSLFPGHRHGLFPWLQWPDCLSPLRRARHPSKHRPGAWAILLLFERWHLDCHTPDFHWSHTSRCQLQHTSI